MSSFAVNRPCVNKGTGLSPGVWLFEEFYFADSVFGSAEVVYTCRCRRLEKSEIAEGDLGKPYNLEIVEPVVTAVSVFDDDGNEIPLDATDRVMLSQVVLEAFQGVSDAVLDFEMGLL